jgi:hypothetical protein
LRSLFLTTSMEAYLLQNNLKPLHNCHNSEN